MGERQDQDQREGYLKLLDAWHPPEGAGDPIGCLATSFTFDSVFFEEECLSRFVRIESDPIEDGPLYLLEREEKLAQVQYAGAIVDRHYCRGSRSLRWDLLGARVPNGVLHAKICLLHWTRCVRLIVASANLTESGYRRNHEAFGVLDFAPGVAAPREALQQVVAYLENVTGTYVAAGTSALERLRRFLGGVDEAVEAWGPQEPAGVRIVPVLVRPRGEGAIEALSKLWPTRTPAEEATVVSPFYDMWYEDPDRPSLAVWEKLLRKRGRAGMRYLVAAEELPGEDGLLVLAPLTLEAAKPRGRPDCFVEFERLSLDRDRPLHAKGIWLESDRAVLYMVGSSNFTSAGLGLMKDDGSGATRRGAATGNLEANLAYIVRKDRAPDLAKALSTGLLPTTPIDHSNKLQWKPVGAAGEDEPAEDHVVLPRGFLSAAYRWDKSKGGLVLLHLGQTPPDWRITEEEKKRIVYGEAQWRQEGHPTVIELPWPDDRPPSGLWVSWAESKASAWWPVTVESMQSLPPPQELRDLPLDVLINILTSARPLYRNPALRLYLRKRRDEAVSGNQGSVDVDPDLDPHRRVDTTGFLLQRTRRVSWALQALRERLGRPAASEQALHWRLRGPVGALALAQALKGEAGSEQEQAFLLAELMLELHRIQPQSAPGCLPASRVRDEILAVIPELKGLVPQEASRFGVSVRNYVEKVFEACC